MNPLEIELERREDKHKVIKLTAKVSPYNVVVIRQSWLKSDGIKDVASITISKDQMLDLVREMQK
jgi:hypothetical protein